MPGREWGTGTLPRWGLLWEPLGLPGDSALLPNPHNTAFCSPAPQRHQSLPAPPPLPTAPHWPLWATGRAACAKPIHPPLPRRPRGAALLYSAPHHWGCDFGLRLAWGASSCPAAVGGAPGHWPDGPRQRHLEAPSGPAAEWQCLRLHWPAPHPGAACPLPDHAL